LRAVRESGGIVLAATDEEILTARDDLMRRAGVLAEPTGAVPLAGLRRMLADGQLADGQTVVLLITGRLVRKSRLSESDLPAIPADLDALQRVVGPI
jgi:threonine synthase